MDSAGFKKNKKEAGGCIHTKTQGDTFGYCVWEATLDFEYDLNALIECGEWRWILTIIYLSSEGRISVGGLSGLPEWAGFSGSQEPPLKGNRESGGWVMGCKGAVHTMILLTSITAPPSSSHQITGEFHVQG